MTKIGKSKFVDVRSGTPDRSRKKKLNKSKQLQEKPVPKNVKDVEKKIERTSALGSLIPTRSQSILSVSMDSEDFTPSGMTSGLNTPTPTYVAPSSRKNSIRMAKSADIKKPARMSQISINSSIVPGKSIIAVNKKLRNFVEPTRLYKIKKDRTNEMVQVIPGATQSDDNEDEYMSTYATSEEERLGEIVQGEDEKTDSEDAITSMRESQMSVSSDSNIRMRLTLLHSLRSIPNWDELSTTSSIGKMKTEKEDDEDLGRFRDPLTSNSNSLGDSIQSTELEYEEILPPDDPDVQSLSSISASDFESDDDSDWESEKTKLKSSLIPTFTEISSGSWSSQASTHVRSHVTFTIFCLPQASDRLKFVTETALSQMRKKRDLMSETRLVLIIKQHNNAYIKQKIDETETISGEVKMDTYLSTETDVQQLSNTLANRNAELHRMYALIKSKIHTTSHLRCRRKLLSRKFLVAKAELRKKQQQHLTLRDQLYTSNLKHNKLHAKIKEVRQKGGIMCYPKLLADFDLTVNLIMMKRDRVQELKEQHDSLLRKIDKLEFKIQESTFRLSIGSSD
ncbi:uncharacterized protein LOC119548891 isoform X3 [Drosophila subpulchrella]|uniref:uncharacterized protein LOC119548891 isoform X3 n=1 Tax=Drosophila subpulchrella TaxID=1486046 RepID=UPI0018A12763|nr:uncharacterized protein LOC119548891 isoform X3 [Drosophila subpulchrella]